MKKGDIVTRTHPEPELNGEQGKVQWVVENEASVKFNDGGFKIIEVDDKEWAVTISAAPTYQSTVEQMTDEELRASIDGLRRTRVSTPKPTRSARTQAGEAKDDPLARALGNMKGAEKEALMKKLGLV